MRLKVGDLVRVREGITPDLSDYDGHLGFVDEVDEHDNLFPYRIRFISNGDKRWFSKEELDDATESR